MVELFALVPGIPVVRVPPAALQVGDGPTGARFEGLRDAEAELVRRLRVPMPLARLVAQGLTLGITEDRSRQILEALREAGLLRSSPAPVPPVVLVDGLSGVGVQVATRLRRAGHSLALLDACRVAPGDVGPSGYASTSLGARRDSVALEMVQDDDGSGVVRRLTTRPDACVVVRRHALRLADVAAYLSADLPHLPVVVGASTLTVGPLVVPGRTACLRCVDLHRSDASSEWPGLVLTLEQDATVDDPAHTPPPQSLVDLAVGWACASMETLLAGGTPWTAGQSIEVSLPDGAPLVRRWEPHPDCGCADLLAA